jgi:hypothetical protein
VPTWPADALDFYWNENTSSADPYNLSNHTVAGYALEFLDHPNLGLFPFGTLASFTTFLVGVRQNGEYVPLRQFSWVSSFTAAGYGDVFVCASIFPLINGTGGIESVRTNLQPIDISPDVITSLAQDGSSFPVTIQPASQVVATGANVTFSVSPTNNSSPLNYQWRINGTNIAGATNVTLRLVNVTTNSTGKYDAVLSDSNGNIASAVATLTVLNAPLFQSPILTTNGQFVLSWIAGQGQTYQLQYKTNLNQLNWINVGSALTTSNTVVYATNAIGLDKQRFYRVQKQ